MFHWLIHKVHYDTHARLLVLFTFAGILRYLNSVIHVTSMDSYSTTILLAESLFNYLSPQLTTFTVLEWFSLNLVIESCFYGDEFTVSDWSKTSIPSLIPLCRAKSVITPIKIKKNRGWADHWHSHPLRTSSQTSPIWQYQYPVLSTANYISADIGRSNCSWH